MMASERNRREFENAIEEHFLFLESEFGYKCSTVREVDEDPRDSYVLVRFSKGDNRIDVAWNELAMALGVLIRIPLEGLGRKERYVHLEPLVEFLTNGKVLPITPQLYPGASMGKIEKVMKQREGTFRNGITPAMKSLAKRLREYLLLIQSTSAETVREYHSWYQKRGQH
jgi:hypothetical protein